MSQGDNPTESNQPAPWWVPGPWPQNPDAPTASVPPVLVGAGRPTGTWSMPPEPPTQTIPLTPGHTSTPYPPTQSYAPIVPPWPSGGYPAGPPSYPPTAPPSAGYPPPPGYPPAGYHLPASPPPPQRARGAVVAAIAMIAVLAIILGIAGGTLLNHSIRNTDAQRASGANNSNPSTLAPYGGNANPYNGSNSNGFGNGNGSGSNGFGSGTGQSGQSGSSGSSTPSAATSAIAAKVTPAIVDINTNLAYQNAAAAGTGMILTPDGEILTNNHVISGATTIKATVIGTGKTYDATVVGYSPTNDVAVLQLKGASGLPTIPIADSDKVSVNDAIVAAGNAGGRGGAPSVVNGTVTATNQGITASDEDGANSEKLTGLIQTNAPIEPGDSGGPLINSSGKVIGMDTAASASNQFQSSGSVGYAIPINSALNVAKEIKAGNETATIYIGLPGNIGITLDGSIQNGPATATNVVTSSPAAAAGIEPGDTITSINGNQVGSADALTQALDHKKPGQKVAVGWVDDTGQSHTATVALMTGPPK